MVGHLVGGEFEAGELAPASWLRMGWIARM
jgi:hypothetical protein